MSGVPSPGCEGQTVRVSRRLRREQALCFPAHSPDPWVPTVGGSAHSNTWWPLLMPLLIPWLPDMLLDKAVSSSFNPICPCDRWENWDLEALKGLDQPHTLAYCKTKNRFQVSCVLKQSSFFIFYCSHSRTKDRSSHFYKVLTMCQALWWTFETVRFFHGSNKRSLFRWPKKRTITLRAYGPSTSNNW